MGLFIYVILCLYMCMHESVERQDLDFPLNWSNIRPLICDIVLIFFYACIGLKENCEIMHLNLAWWEEGSNGSNN